MRILSKEEAKKIDVDFVYKESNAVAIVSVDFDDRFEVLAKK